jgi:hypothetical protein
MPQCFFLPMPLIIAPLCNTAVDFHIPTPKNSVQDVLFASNIKFAPYFPVLRLISRTSIGVSSCVCPVRRRRPNHGCCRRPVSSDAWLISKATCQAFLFFFFEQGMKDVLYELRIWITIEQQFEGAGRHGEGLQGVHCCHPSCDCFCFALRPDAVFASMVTRA